MNKKIIFKTVVLLLSLTMLTGCSNGKSSSSKIHTATDSNGNAVELDYGFTLNGEKYEFPLNLSDFTAKGWKAEQPDAVSGYYEKDDIEILIRMCTKRDGVDYSNGMEFSARNNTDASYDIEYDGIKVGSSTKSDVENKFGEPSELGKHGEYFYYSSLEKIQPDTEPEDQRYSIGFGFDDSEKVSKLYIMK